MSNPGLAQTLRAVSATGSPLLVVDVENPVSVETATATLQARIEPEGAVVLAVPVTDTVRTDDGAIVHRQDLVEVRGPLLLSPAAIAAVADHDRLQPDLTSLLVALQAVDVDVVIVTDETSGRERVGG